MSDPSANSTRAAQIAALLAMSPPRRVPPELLRAARRQGPPMFLAIFGGIFAVMGFFAAAEFLPWNYFDDLRLRAGDTAAVVGHVTAVADTRMSINRQRVVRYEFAFQPAAGPHRTGVCFTTGRSWRQNDAVTVRYRAENPALCCIAGARLSVGNELSALVLLFPVIGASLVAWVLVARRRIKTLLERGFLAEALVSAIEETAVKVNNRYVHKITLQRMDSPDGGAFVVRQTAPEAIAFARGRLDAKQPVFVLYDPAKPKRALLPEAI